MKDYTRVTVGVFVTLLGVGLLADQIGLRDVKVVGWIFSNLWPLFLLALGAGMLAKRNLMPGVFFIVLGLVFLGSSLFGWSVWGVVWPLFIVCAGVLILFKRNIFIDTHGNVSGKRIEAQAIFWGAKKQIRSQDFEGGVINCMFGGVEYDLSDAKISPNGAEININVIFGGVELRLPKNVELVNNITGILGGVEDKTYHHAEKTESKVVLTGTAIFGGVEIKN